MKGQGGGLAALEYQRHTDKRDGFRVRNRRSCVREWTGALELGINMSLDSVRDDKEKKCAYGPADAAL